MKKFLIFGIIIIGCINFIYYKYYKTGKFNLLLERYPNSKFTQTIEIVLGVVCDMLGKSDSAIFRFNRAINIYTLEESKPFSYYNIAKIYEEKKEIKLALKYYRLTFEKYPKSYYGDLSRKRYDYLLLLGYKEK
ncbi:MAG: tetratricopeptide repeat protein [Endomicrobiia bacterium]